jgi:hypothetical protein
MAAGGGVRARASRSHPLTGEPRAQQQQNGNGQQCHEDENEKRYQNISEHDFTSRSSAAGGCFLFLRNSSGSLAIFAAIRRLLLLKHDRLSSPCCRPKHLSAASCAFSNARDNAAEFRGPRVLN